MKKYVFLFYGLTLLLFCFSCNTTNSKQHEEKKLEKVLIVYYSWTGKTHEIATLLQEKTGADLCRLETQKTYSTVPEIYQEAKEEIASGIFPELKTAIPDINSYDLILIGSPVWWYSVSPAVLSFLSQCDFKGKAVASFCTHGGEPGDYNATFENAVKNATILRGLDIHNKVMKDTVAVDEMISTWINVLKEDFAEKSK